MRTRSSNTTASEPTKQQQQQHNTTCSDSNTANNNRPSTGKTFILPSAASDDANSRLVTLRDPRTRSINRYLFSPKHGLYEFTIVAAQQQQPRQSPRSILFAPESHNSKKTREETDPPSAAAVPSTGGAISKNAELWIATPVDFLFFMIPLLMAPLESTRNNDENAKGLFQPLDDIIDSQDDELHDHLRYILYDETFRHVYLARVESVCDTVEAGDEKMFRFSVKKLLRELIRKAEQMTAQGLPASLEERFVRQALNTPLMAVKREDVATVKKENGDGDGDGDGDGKDEKPDSQSSSIPTSTSTTSSAIKEEQTTPEPTQASSTTTMDPDPSSSAGETPEKQQEQQSNTPSVVPDSITRLLRLSIALSFIKQSYIPASLCTKIDQMFSSPSESPVDFAPLTAHLEHVAALRAEALALRSLTTEFSRKRNAGEEDDEAEIRAEKKRKKEEEEKKKKAGESRAVRDLKKVNTNGMKKMSDFFGSAAASKKKT